MCIPDKSQRLAAQGRLGALTAHDGSSSAFLKSTHKKMAPTAGVYGMPASSKAPGTIGAHSA